MTMTNVAEGITFNDVDDTGGTAGGQFIKSWVMHCDIESNDSNLADATSVNHGIGFFGSASGNNHNIEILENIVQIDQFDPSLGNAAGIILIGNNASKNNLLCRGNIITMNNAVNGIDMSNWYGNFDTDDQKSSLVYDNQITLNTNSAFHQGISINVSDDNHFICNTITGQNTGAGGYTGNGITLTDSPETELAGNTMDDVQVGLTVLGMSGDSEIRFNNFTGDAFVGMEYSSSAVTGDQTNKSNVWNLSSQIWDARHQGSLPIYNQSNYIVQDIFAQSTTPNGWFLENGTDPVFPGCEILLTDNLVPQGLKRSWSEDKSAMMSGMENAYLDWHAPLYIYTEILNDEQEIPEEQIDLFTAYHNTPIAEYADYDLASVDLFAWTSDDSLQVLDWQQELTQQLLELSAIENELAVEYENGELETQAIDLQQTIAALQEQLNILSADIRITQSEQAEFLSGQADALPIPHTFAENERALALVSVALLGDNHRMPTTAELNIVKNIAEQCPENGGRAVHRARAIYQSFTRRADLEYQDCDYNVEAIPVEEAESTVEENNLLVYPNPATATLQLSAGSNTIVSATIFDYTGKVVAVINEVETHKLQIDISAYTSGLYQVQTRLTDGTRLDASFTVIQ